MRRKELLIRTGAAAVLTAVLAGCSSHSATPAAPAGAASTAAVSLPAGCASALGALPKSPPDTAQQATDDFDALGNGTPGTTAGSLENDVSADSSSILFDLDEHLDVAKDVAQWESDAKALRSYCS